MPPIIPGYTDAGTVSSLPYRLFGPGSASTTVSGATGLPYNAVPPISSLTSANVAAAPLSPGMLSTSTIPSAIPAGVTGADVSGLYAGGSALPAAAGEAAAAGTTGLRATLAGFGPQVGGRIGSTLFGPASAVLTGALVGDQISRTSLGNQIINSARGGTTSDGQDTPLWSKIAVHSNPLMNAAWAINTLRGGDNLKPTDSTFFGLFGGGQGPDHSALTAESLSNRLNSLNLTPATRAQFVQDFNDNTAVLEAAGVPHDQAMAQSNAQFFGATDAEGKVTPGSAINYLQQDRAAAAQPATSPAADVQNNLSALVGLIARHAPQYLNPSAATNAWYASASPGMLSAQAPGLQSLATQEAQTRLADNQNLAASQYSAMLNTPALFNLQQNLATQQQLNQLTSQATIDKKTTSATVSQQISDAIKAQGGDASKVDLQSIIAKAQTPGA